MLVNPPLHVMPSGAWHPAYPQTPCKLHTLPLHQQGPLGQCLSLLAPAEALVKPGLGHSLWVQFSFLQTLDPKSQVQERLCRKRVCSWRGEPRHVQSLGVTTQSGSGIQRYQLTAINLPSFFHKASQTVLSALRCRVGWVLALAPWSVSNQEPNVTVLGTALCASSFLPVSVHFPLL